MRLGPRLGRHHSLDGDRWLGRGWDVAGERRGCSGEDGHWLRRLLCAGSGDGEAEGDGGATAGRAFDGDLAALRFHQATRDGEAEARAAGALAAARSRRVGAVEAVEDVWQCLGGDAPARVSTASATVVAPSRRAMTVIVPVVGVCLSALSSRLSSTCRSRSASARMGRQPSLHVAADGLTPGEALRLLTDFGDDGRDSDQIRAQPGLAVVQPGERQEILHQPAHALHFGIHAAHQPPRRLGCRHGPRRSAASPATPPSAVSGVRSSCETSATKRFWRVKASSSCATMELNERARRPISSRVGGSARRSESAPPRCAHWRAPSRQRAQPRAHQRGREERPGDQRGDGDAGRARAASSRSASINGCGGGADLEQRHRVVFVHHDRQQHDELAMPFGDSGRDCVPILVAGALLTRLARDGRRRVYLAPVRSTGATSWFGGRGRSPGLGADNR